MNLPSNYHLINQNKLGQSDMILKAKKSGNSLSIIIPEEMAIELNIADGDSLYVTKTRNGYEISAFDPEFVKRMEIARSGMKKYRNALIELAK